MNEPRKIYRDYRTLLKSAGSTLGPDDNRKIRRAHDRTIEACSGKYILTGKTEIEHALSVASIVAGEMGLGTTTIITALLHESYGRLSITPQELENEFGKKVV